MELEPSLGEGSLFKSFLESNMHQLQQRPSPISPSQLTPSVTVACEVTVQKQTAIITPAAELRRRNPVPQDADCQQASQSASQAAQQASQSASQSIQQAQQSASRQASQSASQAIQQAQNSLSQSIAAASRSVSSAQSSASQVVASIQSSASSAVAMANASMSGAQASASTAQVRREPIFGEWWYGRQTEQT